MRDISRRHMLLGAAATLMAQPIWPLTAAAPDLVPVTPADVGFAPDLEARFDKLIADKRAWGLHGAVLVRDGRLVLERYFEAEDNARGRSLGKVAFKPDTLHDMRSVSKGIIGLLYGIALAQGKVPAPEASLYAAFPEYADLAAGRDRLTIHHVLTMTMGTAWDETTIPYSNPANSEIAMDLAPDRYRYILERRVIMEPGKRWTYCGGRRRCSPASLPRARASRCKRLRARRCSTRWSWAPRNGLPTTRASLMRRRACEWRPATSRASAL